MPLVLQHTGKTIQILLTSGLLPAAAIAIILNLVLQKISTTDRTGITNISSPDFSRRGESGSIFWI